MAVALAGQLREGTKKSHTMAENTGFVACFLKGVVEKKSYRKLISDLYFVYEAMEEEIERLVQEEHPVIKHIGFKSLFRKETLENDLKFYFGDNWQNEINISKSAKEYVNRIHLVAKKSPELLGWPSLYPLYRRFIWRPNFKKNSKKSFKLRWK
jgi:heme oxygenase